ncbi:MAG TPA: hypothetical protein DDY49_07535 [Paenibacillaceae bacterium]|nr:hypothetical protein [Paenibacillaceae bacterium]
MKKLSVIFLLFFLLSCSHINLKPQKDESFKVGLLLEGSAFDQGWNSQAYSSLILMEKEMNATIKYVENLNTESKIYQETETLAKEGYDLIYGNGRAFEASFNKVAPSYLQSHFVFFNGKPKGKNVTSINFVPESIGYFSGFTAGLMTKKHSIGLIPALDSMKEIPAFIVGAKEQNASNKVIVKVVGDWGNKEKAQQYARELIKDGVDILVPMGDAYCIDVIMEAKKHNDVYVIGFVSDQSYISKSTVITSTQQDLRKIYINTAEQFKSNSLASGVLKVDFKEGAQSLSSFGIMVTPDIKKKIETRLLNYIHGKEPLPDEVFGEWTNDTKK